MELNKKGNINNINIMIIQIDLGHKLKVLKDILQYKESNECTFL